MINDRLISYVRDMNKNPVACVVAIGPGLVGVSILNPTVVNGRKDRWNKELAVEIATGRAIYNTMPSIHPTRVVDGIRLKDLVNEAIGNMVVRSHKYFK